MNYVSVIRDLTQSSTSEATEESQESIYQMDENTKNQIKNYFTEEERKTV